MKAPNISLKSVKAIALIICGDPINGVEKGISPYRTQRILNELFFEDLQFQLPEKELGTSRRSWTESWIKAMNGTDNLRKIIEIAVRPSDFTNTDFDITIAAEYLNEILRHDSLKLIRDSNCYVLAETNGVALHFLNEKMTFSLICM